jgi:hypothetical protein
MGLGSGIESGIRDPGSEKEPTLDPGSQIRVQESKRHRIPDPDPQHWVLLSTASKQTYEMWDGTHPDCAYNLI